MLTEKYLNINVLNFNVSYSIEAETRQKKPTYCIFPSTVSYQPVKDGDLTREQIVPSPTKRQKQDVRPLQSLM